MDQLVEDAGNKGSRDLKTFHIHIEGRVQGVGFRPFIYGLARRLSLTGTVANTLEGVHIYVSCEEEDLERFIQGIRTEAPIQSLITSISISEIDRKQYEDFSIVESLSHGTPDLLITPDFAICDDCKKELLDASNRRFHYPYITCTKCGPRFSIERALPYDRQRTTMDHFGMCDACKAEYMDPQNRRFYSQTNSCPECKINQWVIDRNGNRMDLSDEDIVDFISEQIDEGQIVAVKGIGGFLLMCDVKHEKSVMLLRHKKDRPSKPFALMYPDRERVEEDFYLSETESKELCSAGAPILLLKPKPGREVNDLVPYMAPGLDRLGVMLPYAPLFVLIMEKLSRPLLATSGNIKGSPITYRNEQAFGTLKFFADYFLMNDREICVPQDDSVIKFTSKHQQKIIIRKSRGYAPAFPLSTLPDNNDEKVLAMGALLKSTFALRQNKRCHISQFLGDAHMLDAQVSYERTLRHFMKLLKFEPEVIIIDKHPAYFSSQLGKSFAHELNIRTTHIQHHHAHFWAIMGEHGLLMKPGKTLGVIFDGTGMGNDGAIWGGEFFSFDRGTFSRVGHLRYYPHILGDKMAREPKLSALSLLHEFGVADQMQDGLFTAAELKFYNKVLKRASLSTSSMGRLFDGISSLLGFCHLNTYEGEGAMYLERSAQEYCDLIEGYPVPYEFDVSVDGTIDHSKIILGVLNSVRSGEEPALVAARFHATVVEMVSHMAQKVAPDRIVFSGGVMQNGLLVDMLIDKLGDGYQLHFHSEMSPNDECISYGQLVNYMASKVYPTLSRKKVQEKAATKNVFGNTR